MMINVRSILLGSVAMALAGAAHAQAVRMLSGHPPGGAVDAVARIYAERLAESLGRPVVVETRAGAGGRIAAGLLKASPPDGNTLQTIPASALSLYPHTVDKPDYDVFKDFVAVGHVGTYDIGLAVNPAIPAKDFREWMDFVRADKKNGIYASGNAGTDLHLLGAALGQAANLPLSHVAHNGSGPATTDLLGGHVSSALLPMAQLLGHHKAGKMRVLANSSVRRSSAAPEVPTFRELGFPALELSGWYVVIAPAGMRVDLLQRYNEAIVQGGRLPVVRERMAKLDLEIVEADVAAVNALLRSHFERWGPVVKASGFRADSK